MARILTNEMLLENTISVSQFIPSMLISFMYFFYLDVQVSTDIQAIDGLIGAVIFEQSILYHFSKHGLYSSAPIWQTSSPAVRWLVLQRQWSTQWAQPYSSYHSHLAAMPQPSPLLTHQIIWWTPSIGDFVCPPLSGLVSGLGKLCPWQHAELGTSINSAHRSSPVRFFDPKTGNRQPQLVA